MACGTPMIVSDNLGFRWVIDGGAEAVIVPKDDPAAWAGKVVALIADPERRRAMGEAGRAKAAPFAWARIARREPAVYGRGVGHPRTEPGYGRGGPAARVRAMRVALARYRDVHVAETDGFRQFLPGVKQPVYHFTNWRWAMGEMFRFDAARPTSLLYRTDAAGGFVLVGVMYSAPARASLDELDRRVPLGVARWHEHVRWCVPPRDGAARWRELRDGKPVFGPKSPIATAEACAAVGGRFLPRIFGWMVHVMAFERDDPTVIWGSGA